MNATEKRKGFRQQPSRGDCAFAANVVDILTASFARGREQLEAPGVLSCLRLYGAVPRALWDGAFLAIATKSEAGAPALALGVSAPWREPGGEAGR